MKEQAQDSRSGGRVGDIKVTVQNYRSITKWPFGLGQRKGPLATAGPIVRTRSAPIKGKGRIAGHWRQKCD
jgi:hypothetical protein